MDVDELHAVIKRELDTDRRVQQERHEELKGCLKSINGRVRDHDREITGLKVRDAFWAGGAVVLAALIGWLLKG